MSSSSSQKLSPEDIKLRGSLLAKNKDLLKLHKELVFKGLLSEEEFWETRKGLLRAEEAVLKQKRGISAALSAEETAKPVTGTTGTGDIKYVLTPTIIKGIYETHPILKKAFTALVSSEPPVLSEKEFWIEYFKSKFFNEKAVAGAGSTHLDPYFETEIRERKTAAETGSSLDQFAGMVDETVDISRSLEDHVSSEYVQLEGDVVRNDPHWNAFRQFNLHSLKVLQSCKATEKKPATNQNLVEISDLQTNAEPALATLNVQESLLLKRNASKMEVDLDYEAIRDTLLAEKKSKRREYLMDFASFKQSTDVVLAENFFASASQQQPLQIELTDDLNHLMTSSLEVLRHFWRAVSLSNATERAAKVAKMFQVLEQMESKIDSFVRTVPAAKQAFFNLLQVFQVAKLKYQELCK